MHALIILTHQQFVDVDLEEDRGRVLAGAVRVHRGHHLAPTAPGGHEVDDHLTTTAGRSLAMQIMLRMSAVPRAMHACVSQEQDDARDGDDGCSCGPGTYQLALLLGLGHAGVELVLGVARDHRTLLGRHYSDPLFSFNFLGVGSEASDAD